LLALLAAASLWSPSGFADILPTYLSCQDSTPGKPTGYCGSDPWVASHDPYGTPQTNPLILSTLIGYVDQTPEPGTVAVNLTCNEVQRVPRAPKVCDGRWYVKNSSNSKFDSFIGYVYQSQIPYTSPVYIACELAPPVPKTPRTCSPRWYTTEDPNAPFASFVGYVYRTPTVAQHGFDLKYFLGSIVYVPPGQGPSTITYGSGTVTGTTVSTTESWKNDNKVGFTAGIGSISFGNEFSGSTTHSIDLQHSTTSGRSYRGPPSNAISHDYDQMILYLGVVLTSDVDYQGIVTWGLDFSQIPSRGYAASGYPIAVGCLRPNSTIPALQCQDALNFLSSAGLTQADYQEILAAHPFADPNASPIADPKRYVLIDSVNFIPDPVTSTYSYTESNSSTTTNSVTTSVAFRYGAGLDLQTTDPVTKKVVAAMKVENTLTLSMSSTESNRTGDSNTGSFTLSLPSAPYGGPSTVFVYLDTIYKTFMFSFQ
jgi:hypothetical protein